MADTGSRCFGDMVTRPGPCRSHARAKMATEPKQATGGGGNRLVVIAMAAVTRVEIQADSKTSDAKEARAHLEKWW